MVAVIAPCVSGKAPEISLQISYAPEPEVERISAEHEPTMHANADSPNVRPLVVFVRHRQAISVSQHVPAVYWVWINSSTQDRAHDGIELLNELLVLPVDAQFAAVVLVVEDTIWPSPRNTVKEKKTLLLHGRHDTSILQMSV